MARKGLVETNKHRERISSQMRVKRAGLKKKIMDRNAPIEERFALVMKLSKLPRNSSPVRVRSRCALTGRPRAVYRFFGLSRIAFRELAVTGKLPGVTRSSW